MISQQKKMFDSKKLYQSLTIAGSFSLVLSIPWIILRVLKTAYMTKRMSELSGKVVVITGASSGLGEALAHEFYKCGCQVVLCARRKDELDRVRSDLLQMYSTMLTRPPIVMPLDLSDIKSLKIIIDRIISITGQIDILINNGGLSNRGGVADTNIDVDMKIMMINYFGSAALTKAVLPSMIKRKTGHIVFVSSVQGLVALPERSSYSASKHAMQAFADSLRAEVSHHGVNVTIVSPGYIKTAMSVNALTPSGEKHGEMDSSTESGYSPEYVSSEILKAVLQKKKEVVISTIVPKLAIYLRKFLPALYFHIMSRRAKKSLLTKAT